MEQTIIEFGGLQYRIGRLSAMRQLHVMRRVVPVLVASGISLQHVMEDGKGLSGDEGLLKVLGGGMGVVSKMSDEDVEYIVNSCMGCVQRFEANAWAPVMLGNKCMFADIDMTAMVNISMAVLKENMAGFFSAAPAAKLTQTGS